MSRVLKPVSWQMSLSQKNVLTPSLLIYHTIFTNDTWTDIINSIKLAL